MYVKGLDLLDFLLKVDTGIITKSYAYLKFIITCRPCVNNVYVEDVIAKSNVSIILC